MKYLLIVLCFIFSLNINAIEDATAGTVRLIMQQNTAKPGGKVLAAIELKVPKGWHTYWEVPGESGMATEVDWTLPKGISASSLKFPAPKRMVELGLVSFGYEETVWLFTEFTVAKDLQVGTNLQIKGKVNWLACKGNCFPGSGEVQTNLKVALKSNNTKESSALLTALAQHPKMLKAHNISLEKNMVKFSLPNIKEAISKIHFFPYDTDSFDITKKITWKLKDNNIQFRATTLEKPTKLKAVLVFTTKKGKKISFLIDSTLQN